MIKAKTTASLLLTGLMAGGAWAQTASATSDVPLKAGEASTQTQGQPNMATTNEPAASPSAAYPSTYPSTVGSADAAPVTSASGAQVDSASSTAVMGAPSAREVPLHHATVTSNVPTMAGEASTMTNGVPNMSTNNQVTDGSRVLLPPEQHVQRVPQQAGEASTMVGGRPNANPDDPIYRR